MKSKYNGFQTPSESSWVCVDCVGQFKDCGYRQNRSTQKWMVQTVHLGVQQPPRESSLYKTKDIFRQANIDWVNKISLIWIVRP